jgi:hypothetical protein
VAIPSDPATRLLRGPLAAALTEAGYPIKATTLARKASVGGGPPFSKFGRWPLYEWGSSLEWAQSQLSPVVQSTSKLRVLTGKSRLALVEPDPLSPAAPRARGSFARTAPNAEAASGRTGMTPPNNPSLRTPRQRRRGG